MHKFGYSTKSALESVILSNHIFTLIYLIRTWENQQNYCTELCVHILCILISTLPINYVNTRGGTHFTVKQATIKTSPANVYTLVNNECKAYFFIPAYGEDIILQLHAAMLHILLQNFYL